MGILYEVTWLFYNIDGGLFMDDNYTSKILICCERRNEILVKKLPIKKYNYYFDKMRAYARKLFDDGRQNELLPFLQSENISIKKDIAGLLFNFYPDLCREALKEIADMTDIPVYYGIVQLGAKDNLKYGIPKDFP